MNTYTIKQKGFTLIELVIVIIILGILSAVAVPKYLDFRTDAQISALKGMVGAIRSSDSIYYSKAAIESKEKSSEAMIGDVALVYGIPHDSGGGEYGEFWENQARALEISTGDWGSPSNTVNAITFANNIDADGSLIAQCYIKYGVGVTPANYSARKELTIVDSGC